MTSPERAQKIDAVSRVVEAEMTLAWQRKSSFEVRAFSLITANLAVATLYFVLQAQLGYTAHTENSPTRALIVISLVLIAVSLVSAGLSVIPRNYPGLEKGAFLDYLREARDDAPHDLVVEMVEMRIVQLEHSVRSNSVKAAFLMAAFVALGFSVILLAVALLLGQVV